MTNRTTTDVVDAFLSLREQLAEVLGVQTVDMLIDRSVTEIRAAFPLVRGISVAGGELDLGSMEMAFLNCSTADALAALNAVTAVMLLILARLLGKRVAQSLAEKVDKMELFESVR